MGDDARLFLSRKQEPVEAIGVVDMAMGVDRSVHRRLRLLPQHGGEHGRELFRAGVDQDKALVGLEGGAAGELRGEPGARRDVDGAAGPENFASSGLLPRIVPNFIAGFAAMFRP